MACYHRQRHVHRFLAAWICLTMLLAKIALGQQVVPSQVPWSSPQEAGGFVANELVTSRLPAPPALASATSRPVRLTSQAASDDQPPTVEQYQELLLRIDRRDAELELLRQRQGQFIPPPMADLSPTVERLPVPQDVTGYYRRLADLEEAARAANARFPLVRLSGFFDWDSAFFSQDANSVATLAKIQNGTGFRRARLQTLGKVTEFTNFSIEMDFATAGHPSFFDVWGEQTNLPVVGALRIGQYRQPVTMDSWTSVRHLEFMERSAPFQALDPFRRVGIMGAANSEDMATMWAYSSYGTGYTIWNGTGTTYNTTGDSRDGTEIGTQGGVSFATRATHLLYYDEPSEGRYLLHVGGGYNFSEIGGSGTTGSGARTYQARAFPEVFVGDSAGSYVTAAGTPSVVDSGKILATSYSLYHAELAGNYGSAHFQMEYMATTLNQMGGPMVFYDGAYAQCGYFLTGESSGYNKVTGVMDYNVNPRSQFFGLGRNAGFGGLGAWEVAARWSYLDLSASNVKASNYITSAGPPPSPNPGVLNETTMALNWWWNEYTRVELDWIHCMLNNNLHGFSAMDIVATRVQVEF